ncbi:MAG: hypothetical protein AB7T49_09015 [Oligoflexales bacterium]
MKLLAIVLMTTILTACETEIMLRAPVCINNSVDLPHEINGKYRFSLPQQNAKVGAFLPHDEIIEITDSEVKMPKRAFNLLKTRGVGMLVKDSDDMTYRIFGAVCKSEAGAYISQRQNADGTYAISELTTMGDNFRLDSLNFNLEALEKNGVPVLCYPTEDPPYFSPGMIIDNRNMDLNVLLAAARPSITSIVFVKVHSGEQKLINTNNWVKIKLM